jgi:hypothetical protein
VADLVLGGDLRWGRCGTSAPTADRRSWSPSLRCQPWTAVLLQVEVEINDGNAKSCSTATTPLLCHTSHHRSKCQLLNPLRCPNRHPAAGTETPAVCRQAQPVTTSRSCSATDRFSVQKVRDIRDRQRASTHHKTRTGGDFLMSRRVPSWPRQALPWIQAGIFDG